MNKYDRIEMNRECHDCTRKLCCDENTSTLELLSIFAGSSCIYCSKLAERLEIDEKIHRAATMAFNEIHLNKAHGIK